MPASVQSPSNTFDKYPVYVEKTGLKGIGGDGPEEGTPAQPCKVAFSIF